MIADVKVIDATRDRNGNSTEAAWSRGPADRKRTMGREQTAVEGNIGQQGIRWLVWVGSAGLLALVAYAAQFSAGKFVSVAGVGIMVSGAALLIGGLLGFLFGIPHRVAVELREPQGSVNGNDNKASDSSAPSAPTAYMPSTDLEQIADWLTKILVGAGIAEMSKVPQGLNYLGTTLAPGLGGGVGSETFAVGLSLYFALLGFLIGFLWTRLYLQQALRWSDTATAALNVAYETLEKQETFVQAFEEDRSKKEADDKAWQLALRQLNIDFDNVSETELYEKINGATPVAQEKIFHQASIVRSANWQANKPLMRRTIPIFSAFVKIDPSKSEYHGELGFALKDIGAYRQALDEFNIAIAKRTSQISGGAAWYEFQRAMCRIHLDKNLQAKQPSETKEQEQIHNDLIIAQKSGLKDALLREGETLDNWIRVNNFEKEFPEEVAA